MLREIENLVAEAVEVNIPFMNPITYVSFLRCHTISYSKLVLSGYCAFTHKAGIHAKAILNNPSTYEILKPEDFGLTRYVSIGYVSPILSFASLSLMRPYTVAIDSLAGTPSSLVLSSSA